MNSLCTVFQNENDLLLNLNDIASNGSWTKKVEAYLLKVVCLAFPSSHTSWKNITICQKLRNIIVHNNGKVRKNDIEAIKYINDSQYLTLNENNEIMMANGFLHYLLDEYNHFLNVLLEEVMNFYKAKHIGSD